MIFRAFGAKIAAPTAALVVKFAPNSSGQPKRTSAAATKWNESRAQPQPPIESSPAAHSSRPPLCRRHCQPIPASSDASPLCRSPARLPLGLPYRFPSATGHSRRPGELLRLHSPYTRRGSVRDSIPSAPPASTRQLRRSRKSRRCQCPSATSFDAAASRHARRSSCTPTSSA